MATTLPAFENAEAAVHALRRSPLHPGPIEMLYLITGSLHASLDVEEIAERLRLRLAEEFRAETCAVVLPDEKGSLQVRGADTIPLELIHQIIQSGKAVFLPEPTTQTPRPVLAAPVIRQDRCLGALYLDAPSPSWTEHDLALLAAIAAETATALENARLFEQAAINPLSRLCLRISASTQGSSFPTSQQVRPGGAQESPGSFGHEFLDFSPIHFFGGFG